MSSYSITMIPEDPRVELHDRLDLTGAEISINTMPAGASVPFVHAHKQNEEIYLVLHGSGHIQLDGKQVELAEGMAIRVAPSVKRQIFAGDIGLRYMCIQVRADSLDSYTADDCILD